MVRLLLDITAASAPSGPETWPVVRSLYSVAQDSLVQAVLPGVAVVVSVAAAFGMAARLLSKNLRA